MTAIEFDTCKTGFYPPSSFLGTLRSLAPWLRNSLKNSQTCLLQRHPFVSTRFSFRRILKLQRDVHQKTRSQAKAKDATAAEDSDTESTLVNDDAAAKASTLLNVEGQIQMEAKKAGLVSDSGGRL
ncbi:hypothetical protein C8R44DRAFT_748581 [Mycena epipterygia]|nr:hypothetical protein C8R44DRAFT_748581 [Mycena epipterygia]